MHSIPQKKIVAIIWPGYRQYNRHFFDLLGNDNRMQISVLWVLDFRRDDPPPDKLLSSFRWSVVGADNIRLSGYSPKTLLKMIRSVWIDVRNADCVFTSTQAPLHSKIAFVIARLQKKKIFIKIEQWREFGKRSFLMRQYKRIDTYLMRHCDMLFPHGINQVRFALAQGVCQENIRVMPFLSDDLSKKPVNNRLLREKLGMAGKKIILYFGRITPRKGLADLLAAFAMVYAKLADVVLLVCGGVDSHFLDFSQAAPYESQCRTLADTMPPGKVIFTGQVNPADKQDYFSLADLFVHPHTDMGEQNEGWGLVLNEAASMSLPIITTDRVGAAPDLVHDGESGYIVPAGDIEVLAARIELLMSDDDKLRRFALATREVFEAYHQPSRIADTLWEAVSG
jgi:glycosyltransferase involved in cell wall biosynthesis